MALQVGELFAKLTISSKDFDKEIKNTKSELNTLGGVASKAFANIGKMATVAVAGVGGLSGAIAGLAPALAGVTGLAGSFASAGIGAVAFGAVATSALGQVFEKSEEIAKIEEKIANADTAKERASAQKELAKAMEGVSEQQKFAMDELSNFKTFWGGFVKEFETPVFNAFGNSLHFMQELLNGLGPTVSNVAGVFESFTETLDQDISNGGFAKFFKWMESTAHTSLQNFLDVTTNVMSGVFDLFMAFTPIGQSMERGLVSLTARFAEWSAGLSQSNGFQKFIEYAKENGPVLMGLLGNLFKIIGNLVVILAPLGSIVLSALETATGAVNGFLDKVRSSSGPIGEMVQMIIGKFQEFAPTIQWIGDLVKQLVSTWISNFQTVATVVTPLIQLVGDKIMEVFGVVIEWWNTNGSALLENFQIVFQGIWSVIQFVMPAILAIVSMIFENVKGVIIGALNIISGVFSIFAGLFTGNWSKMWNGIKTLVKGAIQFIWNIWNLLLVGKLISGIKALGTKAGSLWSNMWIKIQNLFGNFVSWIQKTAGNLVKGVVNYFTNLLNRGVQIFQSMRKIGGSVFESLKQAVYNTILNMKDSVVRTITGLKTGAVNGFNNIKSRATSIFNSVKNALTKPIESAKSTILGIIDTIKSAFSRMKIKIPKPRLPKINVGQKSVFGVPIPTFDIDWFKTGGIATGPSIAGIGEAGSEAIVPLAGRRMLPFSKSVAKQLADMMGGMEPKGGGGGQTVVELIIDGKRFAKAVAKDINQEFESIKTEQDRAEGNVY